MRILYVASEANPFIASGGLADVMGALPKTVAKERPEDTVELILPLYGIMKQVYRDRLEKYMDISFRLAWRNTGATVYKLVEDGVTCYFVENFFYFDRGKLYGEYDDAERFAFFSRAVVEFMLQSGNIPDVLHANDWQTALTVIYLKTEYANIERLCGIRTVYTIHNIEYQGKFDPYILGDIFALDVKYAGIVEFDGCINLMKGAITVSDFVTTVSPHYAEELKYEFFGFGLQDIIGSLSHKIEGVINGIDYSYFSPDKGGDIEYAYTKRTVKSGKAKNKKALQRELGLPEDEHIPMVAMITRFASQKGIDLVLHVAEEILSNDLQLVILGTGEPEYESAFKALAERHGNLRALIKFDRVISKKIYASADMFLMPSKFEPCGLAQMICCSYGTIPIVRAVGGLYDSIIPYGEEGSNGFRFNNYNAHELLYALENALRVFKDEKAWSELRKRALDSDFTWKRSAEKYVEIYNNLLNW
ncbi:MAG: glycogen synthase [Clostridia bacterium]|nr:glycogen synthase [Clostridia bacterium]